MSDSTKAECVCGVVFKGHIDDVRNRACRHILDNHRGEDPDKPLVRYTND